MPRAPRDPLLARAHRRGAREELKEPHREAERAEEAERDVTRLEHGHVGAFLRILGPGIVSGGSDDDPSAIGTFVQAGSRFGYGLLWTAIFTFPLMAAVQEMCARIALQTGDGLGVNLRRRFPMWAVGACIAGLAVSNVLVLGADLAAVAGGVALLSRGHLQPLWLVAPVALAILAMQLVATYEVIQSVFKWLCLSLFAYVAAAVITHPSALSVLRATAVPHVELSQAFLFTLAAVAGTAFSPYIFFWQGSIEAGELEPRKQARGRLHARLLRAARVDVFTGMFFAQLVMYFIILTAGSVLHTHGVTGVQSAGEAAKALEPLAGPAAFLLFALGFIGAGMLAIPVLSGSTAYAITEFAGLRGSLETKPRSAPTFYAIIVVSTLLGVGFDLLHVDVFTALLLASAVEGVVAAPLIALITVVGADRRIMGPRTSGWRSRTLTSIAAAAMSVIAVAWLASPLLR